MNRSTLQQDSRPYHLSKRTNGMFRKAKLVLQSKTGTVGILIISLLTLTAMLAPLIAPHDPALIDIAKAQIPPFWMDNGTIEYPLGTDNLGRDILSRLIYGSQISLLVGVCSVIVAGAIGVTLGILCGFYGGGRIDAIVMRVVDAQSAIPGILLMLVIIGVFGPSLLTLILVIGVTEWIAYTRLIRSEVLGLKQREFIKAARSVGTTDRMIMLKHIFPNIFPTFIVVSTLSVGGAIIGEAGLSFLGLGIQPPSVSWGYMLSEGRTYLATCWWMATFPGIAITITALGIIFLGDWLRDVLDPRSQGRR